VHLHTSSFLFCSSLHCNLKGALGIQDFVNNSFMSSCVILEECFNRQAGSYEARESCTGSVEFVRSSRAHCKFLRIVKQTVNKELLLQKYAFGKSEKFNTRQRYTISEGQKLMDLVLIQKIRRLFFYFRNKSSGLGEINFKRKSRHK